MAASEGDRHPGRWVSERWEGGAHLDHRGGLAVSGTLPLIRGQGCCLCSCRIQVSNKQTVFFYVGLGRVRKRTDAREVARTSQPTLGHCLDCQEGQP